MRATASYLDGDAREVRLLVDHREDLIGEHTRHISRLRWHLNLPTLRDLRGVAAISAAKFIGEVGVIDHLCCRHAFARHKGTAPLPALQALVNTTRSRRATSTAGA